jgi:lysophospholipase L1-like esterase
MIATLLASLTEWFRSRRPVFCISRCRRRSERYASPLSVEVLETRCLPSSTTTVPPLAEIPPAIALMDILFAAQPNKGDPSGVFVGDSISFYFAYGPGAPVWAAYMAPLGMVDYGVGGQTTQSLLFQLSLGQLAGIHPAVVVLDIGGNNLLQGDTPQATAAGVLADVAMIHQYQPQAQVVVLGILPGEQSPSNPYRAEGAQTNQLVSQMLASDPHVTYLDLGSIFLQPDGTISSSMMFDYIHPTEQGYLDLTNALLPTLESFLFPNVSVLALPNNAPMYGPLSPLALLPS